MILEGSGLSCSARTLVDFPYDNAPTKADGSPNKPVVTAVDIAKGLKSSYGGWHVGPGYQVISVLAYNQKQAKAALEELGFQHHVTWTGTHGTNMYLLSARFGDIVQNCQDAIDGKLKPTTPLKLPVRRIAKRKPATK